MRISIGFYLYILLSKIWFIALAYIVDEISLHRTRITTFMLMFMNNENILSIFYLMCLGNKDSL